jgi:hypothetical protein
VIELYRVRCPDCGVKAAKVPLLSSKAPFSERFEDVADILGNSPEIVRKHYAKWSPARQARIDDLMARVHSGSSYVLVGTSERVQ